MKKVLCANSLLSKFRWRFFIVTFVALCPLWLVSRDSRHIEASVLSRWERHEGVRFPGRDFGDIPDCTKAATSGDHISLDRVVFYRTWLTFLLARMGAQSLHGLEIGALHRPAVVPRFANVTYVDGESVEHLKRMYPELKDEKIVQASIIDAADTLGKVPSSSFDFVIGSHLLEHTKSLLRAIENHLRVLRRGGFYFVAVPIMCNTFDRGRLLTRWEHFLQEYLNPDLVEEHEFEHHREQHLSAVQGSVLTNTEVDPAAINTFARSQMDSKYHIHYHTFTGPHFIEVLLRARSVIREPFDILTWGHEKYETWAVLTKT